MFCEQADEALAKAAADAAKAKEDTPEDAAADDEDDDDVLITRTMSCDLLPTPTLS